MSDEKEADKKEEEDRGSLYTHVLAPHACPHTWDGPVEQVFFGESASCSKCGMLYINYALAIGD